MIEMERQNQIEEMARDVAVAYNNAMAKEHLFSDCIIYDITGELIAKSYRKEEWISVEDRLPDVNTDVLVCQGNCLGQLMNVHTYLGDNKWDDEYGYRHTTDDALITHWQPLPQPPKTKGAE